MSLLFASTGVYFQAQPNTDDQDNGINSDPVTYNIKNYFVCYTYNGTLQSMYVDGELNNTVANTGSIVDGNVNFAFGWHTYDTSDSRYYVGYIDEVSFWNRSLSAGDVTDLWNSGAGLFYPFTAVETPTLSLISFDLPEFEGESYYSWLYYRNEPSGDGINNSNCNVTFNHTVSLTEEFAENNFTLCQIGKGCDVDDGELLAFTDLDTLNASEDFIDFDICHIGTATQDFDIQNIQCGNTTSPDINVDNNDIPVCSSGFAFFRMSLGQNCTNKTNINFTITNGGIFSKRFLFDTLAFDREFSTLFAQMDWNSSGLSGDHAYYHVMPQRKYEYYISGVKQTLGFCDDTTVQGFLTIGNIAPQIFHTQITTEIDTYVFFNGTVVNSTNFTDSVISFLTTVIDDDFQNATHTITNMTGFHVWNETHNASGGDVHNLTVHNFTNATDYNFTTVAWDNVNKSVLSTIFRIIYINDIINPIITPINPFINNTHYANDTAVTFNASCFDTNVWQMQVNVSFGGLNVASNYQNNLNRPLDFLTVTHTFNNSGNGTITWECGDRGTDIYLDPKDFSYDDKKSDEVTFTNTKDPFSFKLTHDANNVYDNYKIKKLTDSYAWELCLTSPQSKIWSVTEYIEGDFIYLDDSSIPAHFVSSDGKTFIKYLDEDEKPLPVKSVIYDKTQWVVVTEYSSAVLCHDPLTGSTNTVTQNITFIIDPTPLPEPEPDTTLIDFDLSDQTNVILLFAFLMFYFGLIVIAYYFKNFGFASFGFFIGLVCGFMLAGLSIFLTLLFFLMNITIYIKYASKFRG